MIASAFWALAVSALAMIPGWMIASGARRPGMRAAWGAVALVLAVLVTALIGVASHALGLGQVPSTAIVPASLILAIAAWRWRGVPRITLGEWQGWAFALAFAAVGLAIFALFNGIQPDGSLVVRRWYNADGFKHLGHVNALANWGVPARDIFGNGGLLFYYWLSYIVAGAATALGGNAIAATVTWNAILAIQFAILLYAAIRTADVRPGIALVTSVLAVLVTLPAGFALSLLQGVSLDSLLAMPYTPNSPALFELSQYIPQHSLAAILLLAVVLIETQARPAGALRWVVLVAFASILAISTILGAMAMLSYGVFLLWRERQRAIVPLLTLGALALFFVFVLHVLPLGRPDAAIESPLFANEPPDLELAQRMFAAAIKLVAGSGLPLMLSIYLLIRARLADTRHREGHAFAIALLFAALTMCVFSAGFLPTRITIETLIRAKILVGLAVAIVCGGAFEQAWRSGRRERGFAIAIAALLAAVALPGDYVRIAWLYRYNQTVVPSDDLAAMAYLRQNSLPSARVWQFPEPPVLAFEPGNDAWAPVLAGRAVPNSLRATDYAAAEPYVERSKAYFAGEPVGVPRDMDWVYLSRTLHPGSYDALVGRLRADRDWRQRTCYPEACLFSRSAVAPR